MEHPHKFIRSRRISQKHAPCDFHVYLCKKNHNFAQKLSGSKYAHEMSRNCGHHAAAVAASTVRRPKTLRKSCATITVGPIDERSVESDAWQRVRLYWRTVRCASPIEPIAFCIVVTPPTNHKPSAQSDAHSSGIRFIANCQWAAADTGISIDSLKIACEHIVGGRRGGAALCRTRQCGR